MATISDTLRSLFGARLRDEDGRYTIDILASEVEHETFEPRATHRVAILGPTRTPSDAESAACATTRQAPEEQLPGPPVEEGEHQTVTVETRRSGTRGTVSRSSTAATS